MKMDDATRDVVDGQTHVGAYRIERMLGRGGMGEVLLAWDQRLERHVAIKRVRTDRPIDPRRRARFRREARAIARLSHPAIVQIFDIIDVGDTEHIVMEYVDGSSLDALLAGSGLDLRLVLRLGVEIADGLGLAHAKGLIHRDLKPENVIVTPSGHAKILDFGLAHMLALPGQEEQGDSLTESGAVIGTASAMSPEQARGRAVDHRSDLFALGSLLYHMITGKAPFAGDGVLDTLHRVISHQPTPVAALRSDAPAALCALIEALLAKAPSERPESARLVMTELDDIAQRLDTDRSEPPSGPAAHRAVELASMARIAYLPTASEVRAVVDAEPVPVVRVLVMTELVARDADSAGEVDEHARTAQPRHQRAARDALARFGGMEAGSTERGFSFVFERPAEAIGFALAYHQAVARIGGELAVAVAARAAIHLGEVELRYSASEHVARGARPVEVSGPAMTLCGRILRVALPGQTLLGRAAFDLARQPAARGFMAGADVRWLAHGAYALRDTEQPVELCEMGVDGVAPLTAPPDTAHGKRIVAAGDELTLGWRPAAGQTIPRRPNWTLIEPVGQGGFGEAWLAGHVAGETRVFKFCFEADRVRALEREITLVRLLENVLGQRHDIARVLDWNLTSAPYFIESEYTEGGDLADWSDEQGGMAEVPMATRLELAAEVAEALAAAHSVGVLHKDIKPQNVLITRDRDGRPHARLADFGLGMVLDRRSLEDRGITALGFTFTGAGDSFTGGSLRYVAPELMDGKPASIQADIYSLGVMVYQMVAGDLGRALAPGWQRDIDDELLCQDIASMVDRAPERRPASAADVADRLRTLDQRHQARAAAERAREEAEAAARALERAQRRRRVAGVVTVLALAMLVVVSVFAYQARAARQREQQAREQAELRRAQAEQLIEFMLGDLRKNLESMGKLALLDDIGERALDYFAAVPESELSDRELHSRAKALHQIGQVRVAQGKLAEATVAFRESLRLAKGLSARDPASSEWLFGLGQSHFWVGYLLWQQKDRRGALGEFRAYLDISERLVARDPQNRAWMLELAYAHSNIGTIQRELGDTGPAHASLSASAGIMETLLAQSPDDDALRLELSHVHIKLGDLLAGQGDLAGAAMWLRKYLETMQRLVADRPDDMQRLRYLGYAHNHLGTVVRWQGDGDAALAHVREALAIAERLAERDRDDSSLVEDLATARNKVAYVHLVRGELDQAAALLDAERALIDALLARDPAHREWRFGLARSHWSMAWLLAARGQTERAVASAGDAVTLLGELVADAPDDEHREAWLASAWWLLGRVHERAGAKDRAQAAWHEGLAISQELVARSTRPRARDMHARLLLSLGRSDQAQRALDELDRMGYREPDFIAFRRERLEPVDMPERPVP